ncbi:hypothetical protein PCANC_20317 [Puccinia coronata f. sp. avenae]|uniref:Uncharacterized protein n=1 Tax=Puccinia coronata f. sp. avenae TaxID=200324 RepID=A0A2N5UV61_9BASI|nr:hypothetical protein PCANC_20317 [Puccinia coronata f. sp. avenae]PLW41649.1 hypothetical protein PCASD_05385 [Puccinia coronata f. sp. avenae]
MAAFILQSVHWAPTWTTVKRPAVPLWTSLHNGPAMVRQSGVPWSSFTHQKLDVLCTVQRRTPSQHAVSLASSVPGLVNASLHLRNPATRVVMGGVDADNSSAIDKRR